MITCSSAGYESLSLSDARAHAQIFELNKEFLERVGDYSEDATEEQLKYQAHVQRGNRREKRIKDYLLCHKIFNTEIGNERERERERERDDLGRINA